jgi:cobalt/nickel transport system ATP-binding protein
VELINRARLKLPIVVDLYQELVGRGLLKVSRPPKNILEMTDMLRPTAIGAQRPGRIYIVNVEGMSPEEIRAAFEDLSASYTGAMGTNAKFAAERSKIHLDFTYGVIDKCILKAIAGKSSLIMTSGGMVAHALKRVQSYGDDGGTHIETTVIAEKSI